MAVRLDQYQRLVTVALSRAWRPVLDRRTRSWSADGGRTWAGWTPTTVPSDVQVLYTRRHGLVAVLSNLAYRWNRDGSMTNLGIWPVDAPRPPMAGTDDGFVHVAIDYDAETITTTWMDDHLQVTQTVVASKPLAVGVVTRAGLVVVRGDKVMLFHDGIATTTGLPERFGSPALVSLNRGASWIDYDPGVRWHRWPSWGHVELPDQLGLWGNQMSLRPLYTDALGVVCLESGLHDASRNVPGEGIVEAVRAWQGQLTRVRWADGGLDDLSVLYTLRADGFGGYDGQSGTGTVVGWNGVVWAGGDRLAGLGIPADEFWEPSGYSSYLVTSTPFRTRLDGTAAGLAATPLDPAHVARLAGDTQPRLVGAPGLLWASRLHPDVTASQIWWRPGEAPFVPAPPPDWRDIVPLNVF